MSASAMATSSSPRQAAQQQHADGHHRGRSVDVPGGDVPDLLIIEMRLRRCQRDEARHDPDDHGTYGAHRNGGGECGETQVGLGLVHAFAALNSTGLR